MITEIRELVLEMMGTCHYPDCAKESASICEICDTHFCEDHGTPHKPRLCSHDTIAVCWKCGGS